MWDLESFSFRRYDLLIQWRHVIKVAQDLGHHFVWSKLALCTYIIIMTKKMKMCGNNATKLTWLHFIYVIQSSWIVDFRINLYRHPYQDKCLIDSSITENETAQKHLSKICYLQKCDLFNFVLMLSAWLSHWLVMRWTKHHSFCRFCLFFTCFGLTLRHVKTSDETIHQGCSKERTTAGVYKTLCPQHLLGP